MPEGQRGHGPQIGVCLWLCLVGSYLDLFCNFNKLLGHVAERKGFELTVRLIDKVAGRTIASMLERPQCTASEVERSADALSTYTGLSRPTHGRIIMSNRHFETLVSHAQLTAPVASKVRIR